MGFYTVEEAAGILGMNPAHIRRQLNAEKIHGIQMGRTWIVGQDTLEKFKEREDKKPRLSGSPATVNDLLLQLSFATKNKQPTAPPLVSLHKLLKNKPAELSTLVTVKRKALLNVIEAATKIGVSGR